MSHIEMKAQTVIEAMTQCIAEINLERRNRVESVESEMLQCTTGFFRKRKYQSVQEYFSDAMFCDDLTMRHYRAKHYREEDMEQANRLLLLAKHGDPVIITSDHIHLFERNDK